MFLTAFEPGREMAIANFFLAIFCLFTVALPLLLITRGDKTKANQDFLVATVNPWSQIAIETELPPVALSEITSPSATETNQEDIVEQNIGAIPESKEVISIEINESDENSESSQLKLGTEKDLLAA